VTPPDHIKAHKLEELIEALSEVVPRKKITKKEKEMMGLFWNIRGLGLPGRVPALVDKIKSNHVDFVGVIQTKKTTSLVVTLEP
jgi:hypothetical protein